MRHLGYLRRTPGLPQASYRVYADFASSNAESVWWHARRATLHVAYARTGPPVVTGSAHFFNNDWRGPSIDPPAVATGQISALTLFASQLGGKTH